MNVGIVAYEMEGAKTGVGRYLEGLLAGIALGDCPWRWHLFFKGDPFGHPLWEDGSRFVPVFDRRPAARPILWEQLRLPRLLRRAGLDLLFSPAYSLPHAVEVCDCASASRTAIGRTRTPAHPSCPLTPALLSAKVLRVKNSDGMVSTLHEPCKGADGGWEQRMKKRVQRKNYKRVLARMLAEEMDLRFIAGGACGTSKLEPTPPFTGLDVTSSSSDCDSY